MYRAQREIICWHGQHIVYGCDASNSPTKLRKYTYKVLKVKPQYIYLEDNMSQCDSISVPKSLNRHQINVTNFKIHGLDYLNYQSDGANRCCFAKCDTWWHSSSVVGSGRPEDGCMNPESICPHNHEVRFIYLNRLV